LVARKIIKYLVSVCEMLDAVNFNAQPRSGLWVEILKLNSAA
jgi:hypothetical protein